MTNRISSLDALISAYQTLDLDVKGTWEELAPGTPIRIVKLAPGGSGVANYPGVVTDSRCPSPWIAAEATWTAGFYDLDGLHFVVGDRLNEYFSPADWFNVFSVFAPDGALRGWYANVTFPARIDAKTNPPSLSWHDLYIDIIVLADGAIVVRDEEELAESGLETTVPELYSKILATRDEVVRRAEDRSFPFHERSQS